MIICFSGPPNILSVRPLADACESVAARTGRATVYLDRVEIGGLAVSGSTFDFLIHTFFLPPYPNAKIHEQFEPSDRIDRIEMTPAEARIYIRK